MRRCSRSADARPLQHMASHVSHVGVHDHGFNNISTYGNLLRLARDGRIAGRCLGDRVLRAGPEGLWRHPGGALDGPAGRPRLHLLVQRAALALCRHDAVLAIAGGGARARARADGRARSPDLAAAAPDPARGHECPIQRVLRQGTRLVRRARPRGPRVDLQRHRRVVPVPVEPAGLLAVHDVDARARVGAARLRGRTRVPRDADRRRVQGDRAAGRPRC